MAKLLDIQKSVDGFSNSEDSEKKNAKGLSEYKYTPGWVILETIRKKMNELGLLLLPNVVEEQHDMIDRPVFKNINGTIMSFNKREMFVDVKVAYTWHDVETGETMGPIVMPGHGANGTDKSYASALALSERYFFLKTFHIPTRDREDEPDAHDCDYIPGIPAEAQPPMATDRQIAASISCGTMAQPYPANGAGYQRQYPQPAQAPEQDNARTRQIMDECVRRLSMFQINTPSHNQTLGECLSILGSNGIDWTRDNLVERLKEYGQAMREGRNPNL